MRGRSTVGHLPLEQGTLGPNPSPAAKNFMRVKCSQCGICCRLFLINLTEEEYRSGKYKTQFEEFGLIDDFHKVTLYGVNILKQKEDGICIYLKENKCSIHKTRPRSCREFFCTSKLKKFGKMIEQIKKSNDGSPITTTVVQIKKGSFKKAQNI